MGICPASKTQKEVFNPFCRMVRGIGGDMPCLSVKPNTQLPRRLEASYLQGNTNATDINDLLQTALSLRIVMIHGR